MEKQITILGDVNDLLALEIDKLNFLQEKFRHQLERIVDISTGIIYIINEHGCFTFINNAVEQILHYSPAELIGKHFSTIMSQSEFTRVGREHVLPRFAGKETGLGNSPQLFDERRTGTRGTKNLEVKLLTKEENEVRLLAGDVTGIVAVEGTFERRKGHRQNTLKTRFLGSQGIIFDITRYKLGEHQKFALHKRLLEVEKNDAVGRLAGTIAHDLNNKVGTILGCAELIEKFYGTQIPDIINLVKPIITASRKISETTRQLVDIANNSHYDRVAINLHNVVGAVIDLVKHSVKANISIHHEFKATRPAILGNPTQIQSAIFNVAMNACESMSKGGTLTFKTRIVSYSDVSRKAPSHLTAPGKYVCFSVVDTGGGISEKKREKIYDVFYAAEHKSKGISTALASALGCVKDHKGFIEIVNQLGHGTSVEIYFPYSGVITDSPGIEQTHNEIVYGTGKILIVDDEVELLKTMEQMMGRLGYLVTCFTNCADAIVHYTEHSKEFDAVILDVVYKNADGLECFRELKKINPTIKAILFTGVTHSDNTDSILREGVLGFIHKPFELAQLSQVVAKVIKGRKRG